jgi:peptidyl-prolyl cis-trans isomerase C
MTARLVTYAAATLLLAATTAAAQNAADDPVAARVNGTEIHRSDVVAAKKSLPAQVQQMPLEQIYAALVDQLVTGALIADAGRKDHLAEDAEVKKRTARLEDRVIQEVYINRMVEKAATDEALHKRYDRFVHDHPAKEEVSARHILVEKEEDAKAVIAQLDKGADFAAIAKEKSMDPAKDNGGDLGFFSRDEMVPEFAAVAFALGKGEYTKQPVHTQFGWHVIKVEDKRTAAAPSFEESKEEMTNELAREVIGDKIKELRGAAKVETFAFDGTPLPPKN